MHTSTRNSFIKNTLFIILSLITSYSFSQRNDCDDNAAAEITVGASCSYQAMNSTNGTDYWNSAAGCGAQDRDDVWMWFDATANSTTIDYAPAANRDAINLI